MPLFSVYLLNQITPVKSAKHIEKYSLPNRPNLSFYNRWHSVGKVFAESIFRHFTKTIKKIWIISTTYIFDLCACNCKPWYLWSCGRRTEVIQDPQHPLKQDPARARKPPTNYFCNTCKKKTHSGENITVFLC